MTVDPRTDRARWYDTRSVGIFMQTATVMVLLITWQGLSGRVVPTFYASKPTLVFPTVWHWITTGFLWPHLLYTAESTFLGFMLGATAGIGLGLLFGLYEDVARVLTPYVMMLNSIPSIALAPMFVLWFGLGLAPKIYIAAFIVFFLVFLNVYAGVSGIDQDLVVGLRLMGASRSHVLRYLVLPTVAVRIFAGLRTSFPYALHGAIIGEVIASTRGLGYLAMWAEGTDSITNMFAVLLVLMVVAVAITVCLDRIERALLKWRSIPT